MRIIDYNVCKKAVAFLYLIFLFCQTSAQTVSIQVFNGASGVQLDTIDVYLNGVLIDNLPLGYFSAAQRVASGNVTISVNRKNSTSVMDNQLKSEVKNFTYGTGGFEGYHVFIMGVDTPAQYAPNPDGKATGIQIWNFVRGEAEVIPQGKVGLLPLTHAVTDLPEVNYKTRKDTLIGKDVPFNGLSDVSISPIIASTNQIIDIVNTNGTLYYASFDAPLNLFNRKTVFPVLTGFWDPAQNQNGIPLTVYLVDWFDTLGGQAKKLNPAPKPKGSFQFIHNSATVSMDTIDVYFNGVKYNTDNLAFRNGSKKTTIEAGLYSININRKNSLDSGDLVIKRFSGTVETNKNSIWMLIGLDSASSYTPDGFIDPNLRLLSYVMQPVFQPGYMYADFVQGCTDAQTPLGLIGYDKVYYANTPAYASSGMLYSGIIRHLVRNDYDPPVRSFMSKTFAPNPKGDRQLIFTSGFFNPKANRNGLEVSMVFMDSTGNAFIANPLINVRVLHNSADTSLAKIDIWIDNDSSQTSNLAYKKCSNTRYLTPGVHTVTVMKRGSADTTNLANRYLTTTIDFKIEKDYVLMLCGVKDTQRYSPNPDGLSIGLKLTTIDNFAEHMSKFSYRFVNGVTDSKIMRNPISAVQVEDQKAPFGTYTSRVEPALPGYLSMASYDDSIFYGLIKLPYGASESMLLFTTGFADSLKGAQSTSPMRYCLLYPNNKVVEIAKVVWPQIQFINATGDIPEIDIYYENKKIVSGLKQNTISTAIEVYPGKDFQIAYIPTGSGTTQYYLYSRLLEGTAKTIVIYGLLNPDNYKPNPNGYNTKWVTNASFDVQRNATGSGSCDIYALMTCTDLPRSYITCEFPIPATLVYDGYFSGTGHLTINDGQSGDLEWWIRNKNDQTVYGIAKGKIENRSGLTGIAFFPGFSDTAWQNPFGEKPQANQPVMVLLAWPDGQVDTLEFARFNALNDLNSDNRFEVFPIPASTNLSLNGKLPFSSVSLYSITGEKVLEENFDEQLSYNLSISGLNSGLYFLKISGANNMEHYKKVIIK